MYKKTLIFGGTSEGHDLARYFGYNGITEYAELCVATDYGAMVLDDVPDITVHTGRLDYDDMVNLMKKNDYALVIDSTHPFAVIVTENIRKAAEEAGVEYVRLVRDDDSIPLNDDYKGDIVAVDSTEDAVEYLSSFDDNFLLATGAKDLKKFSKIRNFTNRAFARVLPSHMSIEACNQVGLEGKNIIAMQGPFLREMNVITMKQYGLSTIVTKSTGRAGGFKDKALLAQDGYKVVIIGRATVEDGLSILEVIEKLDDIYG